MTRLGVYMRPTRRYELTHPRHGRIVVEVAEDMGAAWVEAHVLEVIDPARGPKASRCKPGERLVLYPNATCSDVVDVTDEEGRN